MGGVLAHIIIKLIVATGRRKIYSDPSAEGQVQDHGWRYVWMSGHTSQNISHLY